MPTHTMHSCMCYFWHTPPLCPAICDFFLACFTFSFWGGWQSVSCCIWGCNISSLSRTPRCSEPPMGAAVRQRARAEEGGACGVGRAGQGRMLCRGEEADPQDEWRKGKASDTVVRPQLAEGSHKMRRLGTHAHARTHTRKHTRKHTHARACTHTRMHACTCTCAHGAHTR